MANLWTPAVEKERYANAYRRPYCACCGLSPSSPKFGGKVIVANPPGNDGKREVMFCEKCAHTEEAQTVYKEIMFPADAYIIKPTGFGNG